MFVREFEEGGPVATVLIVREAEVRRKRDGSEFLRLILGDRTGTLPAVLWEAVEDCVGLCRRGEVVHVTGRYSVHARYGPQLTITAVRRPEHGEFSPRTCSTGRRATSPRWRPICASS